jgi:uncharacterized membrane protein (UPF0182 family)
MQHWKRWLVLAATGILIFGIIYVVFSFLFLDFVVDRLWFQSLGYEAYFWLRIGYRYAVFAGVTILFFLVFFLNFWVASRYVGNTAPAAARTDARLRQRYQEVAKLFRSGSLKVYTPLSLVLAVIIAWPLFQQWEAALFYVFSGKAGVQDPNFGKDISYYLFSLPIYTLLQRRLLIACLLLLVSLIVLYWLEHRMLSQQEQVLPRGAKVHLSALIILIFLIEIWDYRLQSYHLLYTSTHPLFYGPGFVEMRVILPLIWVTLLLLAGTAFSLITLLNSRKGLKVFIAFALAFMGAMWLRHSTFLPQFVDKYFVKPNESARERPFIDNSIKATLAAYNLGEVETREYTLKSMPTLASDLQVQESLRNIPVWDRGLLDTVYKQVQGIRPYYDFIDVDVDRYNVNGTYQQVFVAARELHLKDLPASAQNWVNLYLKYTHGYGAVMSPAAQDGQEPITWFLQDLPPRSDYGLKVQQPGIYYGLQDYDYVIAPNDSEEFDYPQEAGEVIASYEGTGGVPLSSFFRRLLFAVYFKEKNIALTTKTNKNSRILFRRNIGESIKTITPYLMLDRDPYVVVTPQRIFWIQDAYTTSGWYPNAQPYEQWFNYIRNSVKIVVDAYNGSVDYYVADPKDPVIVAYSRMYPGLFKGLEQMPADLRSHLRYPTDLFDIQMSIYAIYHQKDPDVYYKQEDAWEFSKIYLGNQSITLKPYYLTLNLVQEQKHEFILLRSMSPKNSDILRALVVVGNDPPNYGRLIVYSFPKNMVVYGPSQIGALISQDPYISQQFTLWDQAGSEVERGNMLVLPIGGTVVYIQPVYLKSSARLKIPELQRLIVSQGEMVVMDASLQNALKLLEDRLRARAEQREQRRGQYQSPPLAPPAPSPAPARQPTPVVPSSPPRPQTPPAVTPPLPQPSPQPAPQPAPQPGPAPPHVPQAPPQVQPPPAQERPPMQEPPRVQEAPAPQPAPGAPSPPTQEPQPQVQPSPTEEPPPAYQPPPQPPGAPSTGAGQPL